MNDQKLDAATVELPWFVTRKRRTYSVHETHEEARQAALNLGRLMNGTPCGYVFSIQEKMGKFAFISYKASAS